MYICNIYNKFSFKKVLPGCYCWVLGMALKRSYIMTEPML